MAVQNHRSHTAHRIPYYVFAVLQIIIDIAIFQLCIPFKATGEARMFLTGVMLICFIFGKLYGFRNFSLWDETEAVLRSSVLILLVNILYLYAVRFSLSFFALIAGTVIFILLTLTARYFFRVIFFRLGLLVKTVIVLGAGETGELFAAKITSSPFTIRRALCFLDDDESKKGAEISGLPVAGTIGDFRAVQADLHADEAVIAIPTASRQKLSSILNMVESSTGRVLYIPDMYMLTTSTAEIRSVDGMPVISSSQGLLNPVNVAAKNIIDYIGATVAVVVFSPVMLWAAWRIWREDGRPILFGHERIGKNLKPFKVLKFRTMVKNAEEILQEMLKDENLRREFEEAFKFKDDKRITHIGKFLRKTSLDELPQIFNVLRGEMSLTGPRPIVQKEVDLYYGHDTAKHIFTFKPGMTGYWQVSGRNDVDNYQQRIDFDLYDIHNWSVWLDIIIIARTVREVFKGSGAY